MCASYTNYSSAMLSTMLVDNSRSRTYPHIICYSPHWMRRYMAEFWRPFLQQWNGRYSTISIYLQFLAYDNANYWVFANFSFSGTRLFVKERICLMSNESTTCLNVLNVLCTCIIWIFLCASFIPELPMWNLGGGACRIYVCLCGACELSQQGKNWGGNRLTGSLWYTLYKKCGVDRVQWNSWEDEVVCYCWSRKCAMLQDWVALHYMSQIVALIEHWT